MTSSSLSLYCTAMYLEQGEDGPSHEHLGDAAPQVAPPAHDGVGAAHCGDTGQRSEIKGEQEPHHVHEQRHEKDASRNEERGAQTAGRQIYRQVDVPMFFPNMELVQCWHMTKDEPMMPVQQDKTGWLGGVVSEGKWHGETGMRKMGERGAYR